MCKANWDDSDYDKNCKDQHGCESESCSKDTDRWCHVVEYPCDAGSYSVHDGSPSWMTCGNDTPTGERKN